LEGECRLNKKLEQVSVNATKKQNNHMNSLDYDFSGLKIGSKKIKRKKRF
jgi:hypothetical protein